MDLEVGLGDSHLERYARDANEFVVVVRAWNGTAISFRFREVIAVREACAREFADLLVGAESHDESLRAALSKAYESPPPSHPYRVYAFVNADGVRTLEIVAAAHDICYAAS